MLSGGYSTKFLTSDRETIDYATEARLQEKHDAIARNKKLSAETNKRRKVLANKRKVEAQREEKRRKEILAKRREQQKFATERFQRGHVTKKRHDYGFESQFHTWDSTPARAVKTEPSPALEDALQAVRGNGHTRSYSKETANSLLGNNTVVPTENPSNKTYYNKYGAYIMPRSPDRTRQHMKEIADRTELHYKSLNNLSNSKQLFEKQLQQSQQQLVLQHQRALDDLSAAAGISTAQGGEDVRGSRESLCSEDSLDGNEEEESVISSDYTPQKYVDDERRRTNNGHVDNDVLLEDANDNVSDIIEAVASSKTLNGQSPYYVTSNTNRPGSYSAYSTQKQQSYDPGLDSRLAGSASVLNRRTKAQESSPVVNGYLKDVIDEEDDYKSRERPVAKGHHNKAWSTPTPDSLRTLQSKSTPKKSVIQSNGNNNNSANVMATPTGEHANIPSKSNASVPSKRETSSYGAELLRSSYTITTNNEKVFTQPCKPESTPITSALHKVSSAPVICAHDEDERDEDDDDAASVQSAPEPEQTIKSILKRPRPSERRTVFTRQGNQSAPSIRDSIEITKEHHFRQQKKSVRFAERHHERYIEEHPLQPPPRPVDRPAPVVQTVIKKPPIPIAAPRPTPPRLSTQSTPVVLAKKPPRPASAKANAQAKEAIPKPQRSASAGSVRQGPMLKPKAGSPKTTKRTVYTGEEEEHSEHPQPDMNNPVYDDRGLRLDKTPTDDEINWLWDKVRTCLSRSSSSTGSEESQQVRPPHAQSQNPHQISINFMGNGPANMNGTYPRRRGPGDAQQSGNTSLGRRSNGPAQAGYSRPIQSQQAPAMSQNHDVTESMAAFLTAEAMAQNSASENEIHQAMDAAQQRQHTHLANRTVHHIPTALSVEEARLMQSLDRLNERLKVTGLNTTDYAAGTPYNKPRANTIHQRTSSADTYNTNKQRSHQRMGSGSVGRRQNRY